MITIENGYDLVACDGDKALEPGTLVRYKHDSDTIGTIVEVNPRGPTRRLTFVEGVGAPSCVYKVIWAEGPKDTIKVQTSVIKATTRKLSVNWSVETVEDLKAFHNIDCEKEV